MRGRGGYTLVELLVVLALMGLIAALAINRLVGPRPATQVRVMAHALVDDLRAARRIALTAHQSTDIRLMRDGWQRGYDGRRYQLARTARLDRTVGTGDAIRFYPDGSAGGGEIILTMADRQATIRIDRLTGRVATDG